MHARTFTCSDLCVGQRVSESENELAFARWPNAVHVYVDLRPRQKKGLKNHVVCRGATSRHLTETDDVTRV